MKGETAIIPTFLSTRTIPTTARRVERRCGGHSSFAPRMTHVSAQTCSGSWQRSADRVLVNGGIRKGGGIELEVGKGAKLATVAKHLASWHFSDPSIDRLRIIDALSFRALLDPRRRHASALEWYTYQRSVQRWPDGLALNAPVGAPFRVGVWLAKS